MAMRDATVMEEVRARLRSLHEARRIRTVTLAKRLGIDRTAVGRYVNGATPITVSFLEAVAEETRIPIAELIAPPGTIHQLNADEAALIRWLRRWPVTVTRALCGFLAFFADEPSELQQTRNQHELWRRMGAKQRERYHALGVLLVEGALPADVQEGLFQAFQAEQAAYAARLAETAPSLAAVAGLAEVIVPRRDAPPRQSGAPAKSVSIPATGSDRTAAPRRRTVREKR